jgi:glucan phosphorylase
MGFFGNRMLRGASNRSNQRLASEFGSGVATAALALAMGHACYPTATYGDNAMQDEFVQKLKQFTPRPCDAKTACQHVESWLDKGTLSTANAFLKVWGLGPDEFVAKFLESLDDESG